MTARQKGGHDIPQTRKRRMAPLSVLSSYPFGALLMRRLQQRVLVAGLEPLPAPLHFPLELLEQVLVLRPQEVTGLAHQLEPLADRDALALLLRVVRDGGDAPLDLIQREEAAVDRRLHDGRPQALFAAPVQRACDEHLAVG